MIKLSKENHPELGAVNRLWRHPVLTPHRCRATMVREESDEIRGTGLVALRRDLGGLQARKRCWGQAAWHRG